MMSHTPLESLVLEWKEDIQTIKESNRTVPTFASMDEIKKSAHVEITEALRQLYRRGEIEYHSTVNGIPMFGIKTQNT